jgi:transposase
MSKHRTFTPEFKAQVVLELLSGTKSSAELCRQHHLSAQLLTQWKAIFLERAALVFMSEEQRSQDAARIAELERLVGRMTLEAEIFKKATSSLHHLQHGNGR